MPDSRNIAPARGRRAVLAGWLVYTAVVLIAVNLRPGATSVGPVLAELEHGLGLNPSVSGLLTALPTLCFAAFGAGAVLIARRLGTSVTIAVAIGAIATGLLARAFADSAPLFLALSVVGLAGAAIGNILVPAYIKQQPQHRVAPLTTIYTAGLGAGATIPILLTGPLLEISGWPGSLGFWGVFAALTLVPWIVVALQDRAAAATTFTGRTASHDHRRTSLLRSPKAIALTVFFGMQSMQAYVQFGWLAQIYRDSGLEAEQAALATAALVGFGIPGGLIMSPIVARARRMWPYIVAMGTLLIAGYSGVLLAPTAAPLLWSVLLGLAGFAFPTAIALITARSRHPRVTARLSGFTQSGGYLIAAAGPLGVGWLHGLTGGWVLPIGILMGFGVVMTVAGIIASTPGAVDEELLQRSKRLHP